MPARSSCSFFDADDRMHPRLDIVERVLHSTGCAALIHGLRIASSERERANPFPAPDPSESGSLSAGESNPPVVLGEALYDYYALHGGLGSSSPPPTSALQPDGHGHVRFLTEPPPPLPSVIHAAADHAAAAGLGHAATAAAGLLFNPTHGHVSVRRSAAAAVAWASGPGPNGVGEDVGFVRALLRRGGRANATLAYTAAPLTLYLPGTGRRCVAGATIYFDCAVDLAAGTAAFSGSVEAACAPGKVPGLTYSEIHRRGLDALLPSCSAADEKRDTSCHKDPFKIMCIRPEEQEALAPGLTYLST